MIFFVRHSKVKDNDTEYFCIYLFGVFLALIAAVYFGIDIPSALSGGQKIYVDKFPDVASTSYCQFVYADGQQFISFNGYDPDKYEQDTAYCITYTKYTKSILNIEKVE